MYNEPGALEALEEPAIRLSDAPRGFLLRPEFQPRGSAGAGGERPWLPLDPFFAPSLDGGDRSRSLARAAPATPGRSPLRPLFQAVLDRFGLRPGSRVGERLDSLSRPDVRLVITGQQPGFLTGPLYTIYKAVSAAAAARRLEAESGAPHVPVFWVAGEDHDLDEARAIRFPAPGGGSIEFALPHRADRRPLSAYPFDRAAEEVLERVSSHLDGRLHSREARALMDLYRGRDLAGGFAAVMATLFEGEGLLLIEPETLRPLALPIVRRALEEPAGLLDRIREGIRRVEERGVSAQVSDRFPLFLLVDGKRHHLSFDEAGGTKGAGGPRFVLEGPGRTFASSELVSILLEEPRRFSTGVLLRPVVQEAAMPGALYVGGPAELAYFAQLRPVFEWFGLEPPRVSLRLSATLIEGKVGRALRRLGLDPGEDGGPGKIPEEELARRWTRAREPADLLPPLVDGPEDALHGLAADARARFEEALGDPRIPPAQRRRLESAAGKIASEIEALGGRAGRAAGKSREEELAAAVKVLGNFFPDGVLQERRWNILYYVAKYGTGWIGDLVQAAARDPFRVDHRWVHFSERGGRGAEGPEAAA